MLFRSIVDAATEHMRPGAAAPTAVLGRAVLGPGVPHLAAILGFKFLGRDPSPQDKCCRSACDSCVVGDGGVSVQVLPNASGVRSTTEVIARDGGIAAISFYRGGGRGKCRCYAGGWKRDQQRPPVGLIPGHGGRGDKHTGRNPLSSRDEL